MVVMLVMEFGMGVVMVVEQNSCMGEEVVVVVRVFVGDAGGGLCDPADGGGVGGLVVEELMVALARVEVLGGVVLDSPY